ncbi:MAG: 50S ribosomal protein L11 methyltransferase [Clostridiales bacterium]|nr:50S ribosomal protein L11 methyltransferase [Clostridiales bacterium]
MNDYIELKVKATPCSEIITDIIAAMLCDIGYESFVPGDDGVTAYVKNELFNRGSLDSLIEQFPIDGISLKYDDTFVEGRDWNHEWEKNYFQPIVIGGNRCVIHSSFHTGYPQCEYDIVIDPKMAFGTGHHSTTSLIIGHLLELDLNGKSVLDMGTGTGILALLAAMRGASPVTAIEIDPMAHVNAVENVALNNHPEISVLLGDASRLSGLEKVDYMLANINRNIILGDLDKYASVLKSGAHLFLSGFYKEDVPMLESRASELGLSTVSVRELNNWCCLELING